MGDSGTCEGWTCGEVWRHYWLGEAVSECPESYICIAIIVQLGFHRLLFGDTTDA